MIRPQTHREALKRVQAAIVRGHRLGVCDRDGNSVSVNGVMTAKPYGGRVTFRKVYPRHEKQPPLGTCYQYLYGGPGPDMTSVVLVSVSGTEGHFLNLKGDYPEREMYLPLDSPALTRCGPEKWQRLINSQKDPVLKGQMRQAYQEVFAT